MLGNKAITKMEKITSTTFTNTFSKEHLVTVTLYKLEIGYAVLSEFGCKLDGQTRLTFYDAEEYFNEVVQETKKAYHSMEMSFYLN